MPGRGRRSAVQAVSLASDRRVRRGRHRLDATAPTRAAASGAADPCAAGCAAGRCTARRPQARQGRLLHLPRLSWDRWLQERLPDVQRAEARGAESAVPGGGAARLSRWGSRASHHACAGLDALRSGHRRHRRLFRRHAAQARRQGAGEVPQAAQLCTSCHGQDGVAVVPMYPSLAGQHEDYLERAIEEYRKGGRKNPIMKGFAASLKDQDIADHRPLFQQPHALARHRVAALHAIHGELNVRSTARAA